MRPARAKTPRKHDFPRLVGVGGAAPTNRLVEEVALLSQVHGDSRLAGSLNNFLIADGTTGLNNRAHTSVGKHLETIGKGEEGIRCGNSATSTIFAGTLN